MDKNIAALLREDARTVHVIFDLKVGEFDEIEARARRHRCDPLPAKQEIGRAHV